MLATVFLQELRSQQGSAWSGNLTLPELFGGARPKDFLCPVALQFRPAFRRRQRPRLLSLSPEFFQAPDEVPALHNSPRRKTERWREGINEADARDERVFH